jgi:hypothetical protein
VQSAASHSGEAFLDRVLANARAISGHEHFLDDVCLLTVDVER